MLHFAVPPVWAFIVAVVDGGIISLCLFIYYGNFANMRDGWGFTKSLGATILVVLLAFIFPWAPVVTGIIAFVFLMWYIISGL